MGSIADEKVPILKHFDFSLRLIVVPLSVASIWLTVTNKQDNTTYGTLEYSDLLGLKYMICISAVSAGYALFAAASSWVKSMVNKAWLFFVSDQVITYLMVTSMAAVAEIMYLAYYGDREVTWSEACTSYGHFCTKMKIALILHSLALFCFLILALISAYRVFSTFEPPFPSNEIDQQQK